MKFSFGIAAAVLGASSVVVAAPTEHQSASSLVGDLNNKALSALKTSETKLTERSGAKKCTTANAEVRRDW
jgi:hypothetical protein